MSLTDSQITAAPSPFYLDGEEYLATPLTDKDLDELDEWIIGYVIQTAQKSLPPLSPTTAALREELLAVAIKNAPSVSWRNMEGAKILNSPQGTARLAWMLIRKTRLEVTPEQLLPLMRKDENIMEISRVFVKTNPDLFSTEEKETRELDRGSYGGSRGNSNGE